MTTHDNFQLFLTSSGCSLSQVGTSTCCQLSSGAKAANLLQVHWLMCHVNTFMCQNAAATHVSLKMLLLLLPEKKQLWHPWEQEENVIQNLPFFQTSALG